MRPILFLALALLVGNAHAVFTPERGFYWNPDIPGRGYSIEIQDDVLFLAFYVYDQNRAPIWYTSSGQLQTRQDADGTQFPFYEGELDGFDFGTCIGCSFRQPDVFLGEGGTVRIEWLTAEFAELNLSGNVEFIERFNYALGDVNQLMLGEWQTLIDFAEGAFPFQGDVLVIDRLSNVEGDILFEGCRPETSQQGRCTAFDLDVHPLAGAFDAVNNEWVIVVDDGGGNFLTYFVFVALDKFDGVAQLYPQDSAPSGPFFFTRGFRTASRAFVQTGVGPAKQAKRKAKGIAQFWPDASAEPNAEQQRKAKRRDEMVRRLIAYLQR